MENFLGVLFLGEVGWALMLNGGHCCFSFANCLHFLLLVLDLYWILLLSHLPNSPLYLFSTAFWEVGGEGITVHSTEPHAGISLSLSLSLFYYVSLLL